MVAGLVIIARAYLSAQAPPVAYHHNLDDYVGLTLRWELEAFAYPRNAVVPGSYRLTDPAAPHTQFAVDMLHAGALEAAQAGFKAAVFFAPQSARAWSDLASVLKRTAHASEDGSLTADHCFLRSMQLDPQHLHQQVRGERPRNPSPQPFPATLPRSPSPSLLNPRLRLPATLGE